MSTEQDWAGERYSDVLPPGVGVRYRVVKRLGEGGMGVVWLAEDQTLPRKVAIKTIRGELARDPVIRERIERECEYHARIGSHPNIVTLFDKVEEDGRIVLVMEYVGGVTLAEFCEECRAEGVRLATADALSISIQVARALDQIHRNGIVHRDIKPDNVLVCRYEDSGYWAKLMDFGISRLSRDEEGKASLTQAGTGGPGTPAYMAPEQIDSATFGEVGPATDIYSLGAMLYRVMAGKPPFSGTLTEVFTSHLTRPPPALEGADGVHAAITTVVHRAMAKRPEDRYRDARALVDALAEAAAAVHGGDSEKTMPAPAGEATAVLHEAIPESAALDQTQVDPRRRHPRRSALRLAGISGVMLVLLASGSGYVFWNEDAGPLPAESAIDRERPVSPDSDAGIPRRITKYVAGPVKESEKGTPIEWRSGEPTEGDNQEGGAASDIVHVSSAEYDGENSAMKSLRDYRYPDSPESNKKLQGIATVLGDGRLEVSGETVRLDGIAKIDRQSIDRMQAFIREQGATVQCVRSRRNEYQCSTETGYDLAAAALINGAATVSADADEKYAKYEREARMQKRGMWGVENAE